MLCTSAARSRSRDHVLVIDGRFAPARELKEGSLLTPASRVTAVRRTTERVVNPLTIDSRILAAGKDGEPVLASVHPEWIADHMLTTAVYPLPLSLSSGLAVAFPATVQAYYDALLESFFASTAARLKDLKATVPMAVTVLVIGAFDVVLSLGFVLYCLAGAKVVVTLAALGFAAARRGRGKK